MRCLWITRQDPRPADSGELIYSLGLIRSLASQPGIELTVLAHHATKSCEDESAVTWQFHGHIPEGRLRSLTSPLPADAFRLGNRHQREALGRLLTRSWDWIIIDQAACAWALPFIPPKTLLAYIAHNHEATLRHEVARNERGPMPLKLALRWDARKYGRLERRLCKRADLVTAITPHDADTFRSELADQPVLTLLPGFEGRIPAKAPRQFTADSPRVVVLAGAFEWLAKRRNLERFLHAARRPFQEGGIRFQVIGKADPEWFQSLARQHPWADFKSNVPAIDLYLDQARIGLIPEALGGGFKLKALDYIFRGLPVASIDKALSGLPIDPFSEAITASDPESLASKVVSRIDDLRFLNHAAHSALAACRQAFHWKDRGPALAAALKNPHPHRS